jgi:alpha-2-macroglobulin
VLDDDGKAQFDVRVDELPATTQLLKAEVVVRMREGGGRAVERSLAIPVAAEGPMIGIRPQFKDGQVRENSQASFDVIAVDPSGARQDLAGLGWSLVKLERRYQWYRQGSGWNYEPIESTSGVAEGVIDVSATGEAEISVPVEWGRYRLEVASDDAVGPATSVDFEAGWHVEPSSTETPDGLEIALDKETYSAGETAKLQVSPRFAGELLITVGADRLLAIQTASVPETGAVIDIPIGTDWGAGVYVSATLYRPGEAQESRMPMRAIGIKWLAVDPAERKLEVLLAPPRKTQPRQPLEIPVSLAGLAEGETAYVTVAAVDLGIINLTRYETPDPAGWYFGQRQLGLEIRDLYGRLIDGSLGATGRIRTGGDGGSMSVAGSPPKEKLVAFFSGPVRLDAQGKATVSFDIPQFNGTVRVMAVAWTRQGVGNATADVVIRDPVVVTASLPKFLAPGDRSQLRLDIDNTDGPAGEYALEIAAGEVIGIAPADVPATVSLAAGERNSLTIPITGERLGEAEISVALAHVDGIAVAQALDLPVRPAALPTTTRTTVTLAANGGSLRVDGELLRASILDGASVSIGVSRASAFDVPSLLMSLDRYPYGCAEQTTSVAMPLLYLDELAAEAGLAEDPAIRERVQDAIHKVLAYQSSSGSFGLWSPGSGDLWLDSYVTDFLTRAREQKYEVPEEGMRAALENLQNALAYEVDVAANGDEIAYALYVLARNRRASAGDLRYYADTQLQAFATPLARAQLAGALSLYGDTLRSHAAFRSAVALADDPSAANLSRSDYGSPLRDGAAMLALAAETRPLPAFLPDMVRLVSAARARVEYASTQEQAWMLLAARAFREGNEAIALEVNGEPHGGRFALRASGDDLLQAPVTLANRGAEPVEATVTTIAAPVQPLAAGGEGFAIERTYYRLDGTPANITEARQNERFVVVLSVSEQNMWHSRILVTDLLPAGLEIDNPRLVASADLQNFDWLGQTEIAHAEFRSDRFVAALNRSGNEGSDFNLAYVVRAVTPGVYAHPAATVEDMYRPQFSARTATGVMEVTGKR